MYGPILAKDAKITGGFWKDKQDLLRDVTVQAVYDRFEETGRFGALCGYWKEGMPKPHIFWDSDTAKWIEGAAYLLMGQRDAALEGKCDDLIARVCALQMEDGYFNSYYQAMEIENRFTQRGNHELYCLGHWIEAAVAYDQATGKDALLQACRRYVALVDRVFRVERSAGFDTPGHEEIELALYKLYRHTGDDMYMTLMRYFVDTRGVPGKDRCVAHYGGGSFYLQSHQPVRRQSQCEGHSVRAMYLYCAMADQAAEDGDEELAEACRRLFENCAGRRMYVTGGIGSTHQGEAFTEDWDLPNREAYAETCAALGLALFARRMVKLDVKGRYMDAAETALFNGALSGLSLSGDCFFYENPLEYSPLRGRIARRIPETPVHCAIGERVKVFGCSCCPPNVLRVYGSLQEFLYGESEDTLYVHMFAESEARTRFGVVRQKTDYPRVGSVEILPPEGEYTLAVRLPRWAKNVCFRVNGEEIRPEVREGYAYIRRGWSEGDSVRLDFDLPVRILRAHPRVGEDAGLACVSRGPVIYCLEGADNGEGLADLALRSDGEARVVMDETFGLPIIALPGSRSVPDDPSDPDQTYPLYADRPYPRQAADLIFIPFYAWANRGENEMRVWVREE